MVRNVIFHSCAEAELSLSPCPAQGGTSTGNGVPGPGVLCLLHPGVGVGPFWSEFHLLQTEFSLLKKTHWLHAEMNRKSEFI